MEQMAWVYGLTPFETESLSPAELFSFIDAGRLREQRQAFMLHTHAALNRRAMDGQLPEVWEAFPFWTDEEIARLRMERTKSTLLRHSK